MQWLKTWLLKVKVKGSSLESYNLVGETNLGLGLLSFINHVRPPRRLGLLT
jgi:hypothetical protein